MNKYGLYSVHGWRNVIVDVKICITGMFWGIDLLQYLTVLSLLIFSISKALPHNREVETTQKRPLFMKASSFGFCSELIALCVCMYICVYMCVSIYIYVHVCADTFIEDAILMILVVSLAFFSKIALKIKHMLLHKASLKLKLDHQVGEIHN